MLGPRGATLAGRGGGGISRPLPFALAATAGANGGCDVPFLAAAMGPVRGGVVGKGRVSSRSAREYSCLRKNVWASQNASLGSSMGYRHEMKARASVCGTHWSK